jgi:hypothetical protein
VGLLDLFVGDYRVRVDLHGKCLFGGTLTRDNVFGRGIGVEFCCIGY